MRKIVAAVLIGLAASVGVAQVSAQESGTTVPPASGKSAKKEPTEKQRAHQARFRECAQQAGGRKGDERKAFMSTCLKARGAAPAGKADMAEQNRMKSCSRQASEQRLRGKERKAFMNGCLERS